MTNPMTNFLYRTIGIASIVAFVIIAYLTKVPKEQYVF